MGIQFEWQTGSEDGQWETIARTDRGRWLRRISRWVWIALAITLVAAVVGGYLILRRRYQEARREIEFQIQSVIDLEARTFARKDEDLYLAQQDREAPDWYSRQREHFRSNPEPGPELRPEVQEIDLRDGVAWVEVLEGEDPVRRARFYRQTDLGWKHTEPRVEFWGPAIELHYGDLIFRYHKRDLPHVTPLVEHIAHVFYNVCAQVGCPEGQSLTVNFAVDAFIPIDRFVPPEGEEWLLPSPWLYGLPPDGTWSEAVLDELTQATAFEVAFRAALGSAEQHLDPFQRVVLDEYAAWYRQQDTGQAPILGSIIEREGPEALPKIFGWLRDPAQSHNIERLIASGLSPAQSSPNLALLETLLTIERDALLSGRAEVFRSLQDDESELWAKQQQAFFTALQDGVPHGYTLPPIAVEGVEIAEGRALVTLREPLIRVQGYAPQSLGRYAFFSQRDGEWKHSSTGHAVYWNIPLSQVTLPEPVYPLSATSTDKDTVTIRFVPIESADSAQEQAAAFEELYPQISVEIVPAGDAIDIPETGADTLGRIGYLYQIVNYQFASMADVTFWYLPSEISAPGLFRGLTPYIEADPSFDRSDFYPGVLESLEWGDQIWGLPVYGHPFLIGYDRDAFDEANLPYPQVGWTQEDFRSAAQQLTQRDGDEVLRYGYVDCSEWPVARAFVEGRAGPLVDIRTRPPSPRLTAPDVVRAVSWYTDLTLRDGIMPSRADLDAMRPSVEGGLRDACLRLVQEGRVAMWADADYARQTQNTEHNWGIVPFPRAEQAANPWYLYSYAMSSGTRSPEESWLWLHFVSQQQGQAEENSAPLGIVPARRSVAEASGYWLARNAETDEAIQGAMQHAWAVRLDAATAALDGAIADVLAGKPLRTALDEAQIAAMRGQ